MAATTHHFFCFVFLGLSPGEGVGRSVSCGSRSCIATPVLSFDTIGWLKALCVVVKVVKSGGGGKESGSRKRVRGMKGKKVELRNNGVMGQGAFLSHSQVPFATSFPPSMAGETNGDQWWHSLLFMPRWVGGALR